MSWPLTGKPLAEFNRLLNDWKQYGTFPFIGPDDIKRLFDVLVASGLSPRLDDVGNRPQYWLLKLASQIGDEIVPPTPTEQSGIQWGPDDTVLTDFDVTDHAFLDNSTVTSVTFSSLITFEGNTALFFQNATVSVSFPGLQYVNGPLDCAGPGNDNGIMSFNAPELVSISDYFYLTYNPLSSIDLSKLQTVGDVMDVLDGVLVSNAEFPELLSIGGDYYAAYQCLNLVSILHPKLETVTGGLYVYGNPLITEISFPLLLTAGSLNLQYNDSLISISLPAFTPSDAESLYFNNNALDTQSVDYILALCVANPSYVSGIVNLTGGTNSAPSSVAPGSDYDILINRGVTVTVN